MSRTILPLAALALAFGIAALIGVAAPRRWRAWALALWLLAPLLILLAVAGRELTTSAPEIGNLVYGVLLIASFTVLPWLIAGSIGFAIGAALRRRPASPPPAHTNPVEPTPPLRALPDHAPPPPYPAAPTLNPPGGWEAAHVGFDHDEVTIDGLPIWSLTWRDEDTAPVMLAHPAHPAQLHRFTVHAVDDGHRATRFAAAELSNGVWGFYRWRSPGDALAGTIADGSLRYEHDWGPFVHGHYESVAAIARLADAATGEPLFDGHGWRSGRVVPQPDGSLLLSLELHEQQTLFRIDPATRTFRDLSVPGGVRPLRDLARAAAAALAVCNDPANAYFGRAVAPDGSLLVELEAVEWSNTHWVRSPRVIEVATGRVLLDLWRSDWDASVAFPRARTVRLDGRRYHHGGSAAAEIELDGPRFLLFEATGVMTGPVGDLPAALARAAQATAIHAPMRQGSAPSRATRRGVLMALLILASATVLIAAATWLTLHLGPQPPPPKLDTVPTLTG